MLKLLYRALNVREDEENPVLLLLGKGFFMGIFLATYQVTAESLFESLKDRIAEGIFVSGALGVFTTALFTYLQNRMRFSVLAVFNDVLVIIVSLVLFVSYTSLDLVSNDYVVFAMFALIGPIMAVLLLSFWGTFGRIFDLRQSKRIIGGIDTGQLSAAIITFFAISALENFVPNFERFPTENFLVVGSVSLGFSLLFTIRLVNKYNMEMVQRNQEGTTQRTPLKDFVTDNYIVLLAAFMILSTAIYWFVENSYLNVLYDQYQTEGELRSFLGLFNGSILVLSFLLQTFFNDRIIANYGLKVSLWILPIVAIIFTVLSLVSGQLFDVSVGSSAFFMFFLFISLNKLFVSFLRDALENPTFKLYFMPLDVSIRFDIQAKVEGVISQIAKASTGGILLILATLAFFTEVTSNYILLGLLIAMFFTVNKLYSAYRTKIKEKLEAQQATSSQFEPERTMLIRNLQQEINDKEPQNAIYSFKLLEKLNPAVTGKSVNALLDHEAEAIKDFAVIKMNELNGLSVSDHYIIGNQGYKENGRQLVTGQDLEILLRTGEIDKRRISLLARSEKVGDRQYAAELIGNSTGNNNLSYLIDLIHDRQPKVKIAAMLAAQKRYSPEVINALIENLRDPHFSNLAQNSLVVIGRDALPVLESAFYRTGQDLHAMLKIIQIMGLIGGNTSRQLLWNKIDYPDKVLVSQVLKSLGDSGFKANLQQVTRIKYAIESDIQDIAWNLAATSELPQNEFTEQLRRAIHEENDHDIEHIYMLLGMLYDPRSIQLVKENIESGTSEGIAYAIELLDVFLSEDLKQKIMPVLDDLSVSEKMKRLEMFFPRERFSEELVLKQLINRDYNQTNRWTKAITIYQIGYLNIQHFTMDLIANLFNPDMMVKEVAAWSLYQIDPDIYKEHISRLPEKEQRAMDMVIVKDTTGQLLRFNKVRFLSGLPIFEDVPGITISSLVDTLHTIRLPKGETHALNQTDDESFYVIYKGEADLYENGTNLQSMAEGLFIGELTGEKEYRSSHYILATENALVLEINKDRFYELLSDDITFARKVTRYMETV